MFEGFLEGFLEGARVRDRKKPSREGTIVAVVPVDWDWEDFRNHGNFRFMRCDSLETLEQEEGEQ